MHHWLKTEVPTAVHVQLLLLRLLVQMLRWQQQQQMANLLECITANIY
jgi:hypothetical protein